MLCMGVVSCEEFLAVDPPHTQLASTTVFDTDATATSAVLGMYEKITENYNSIFNSQLTLCAGLSADELLNTRGSADLDQFYSNSINPANDPFKQYFWNATYNYIYQANAILEGLANSSGISSQTSLQLQGEARFLRAFSHFYLINLFGDVPYVTSTDYRQNSTIPRTTTTKIYEEIVKELILAQSLLGDNYVTTGRVRPNKAVATALLARVYLFQGDWVRAEQEASKVIINSSYVLQSNLNNVFLATSGEAIWQLFPVSSGINTAEGNRFVSTGLLPNYADVSPQLISSFEPGDKRRLNWVGQSDVSGQTYYFPYKYKVRTSSTLTEYYLVFRLAEQYLIRSEARARQNKLAEAISDIDVIRNRAGLPLIQTTNPSISQADLLLAIEKERRIELFCEWGHRWLDLKRTGRVDAVMSSNKPNWKPTAALYPIPKTEILTNTNLNQNPGY
jgi:hypothetical protein